MREDPKVTDVAALPITSTDTEGKFQVFDWKHVCIQREQSLIAAHQRIAELVGDVRAAQDRAEAFVEECHQTHLRATASIREDRDRYEYALRDIVGGPCKAGDQDEINRIIEIAGKALEVFR